MPRKAGTDTLFKLPKSESVPVFRCLDGDGVEIEAGKGSAQFLRRAVY